MKSEFPSRWRDKILSGITTRQWGANQHWRPADFANALDIYFEKVVIDAVSAADDLGTKNVDRIKNALKNTPRYNTTSHQNHSGNIRQSYNSLLSQYDQLIDARRQEDLMDFWAHVRSLLFRVLTALGIAAVVLLTGWLAQMLQIPLPAFRVPPL